MEKIGNTKTVNLEKFTTLKTSDKHEALSNHYKFASTGQILERLAQEGWTATQYNEKKVKLETKQGFQNHVAILENQELNNALSVSGTLPRLIIKNSHDGKSSLQFTTGLYEAICANGLVVGNDSATARIIHTQINEELIINSLQHVIDQMVRALLVSEKMKSIKLEEPEALAFKQQAIDMVWNTDKYEVNPNQLTKYYRTNQNPKDNFWNLFNVVQESVIKGGVLVYNKESFDKRRAPRINSIDRNLAVNKGLWNLAETTLSQHIQ